MAVPSSTKVKSLNPDKVFMEELLYGESRRLCRVFRFNSSPVLRTENVAEHSWYVVFICLNLHAKLRDEGVELDLGVVLSRAAMHDMDEALTGDIPRPFKYHNTDTLQMLEAASQQIFEDYAKSISMDHSLLEAWRLAKEGPEGLIVKAADLLSVVSYAVEEKRMGNQLLVDKLGEVSRYMVELHRMLLDLTRKYKHTDFNMMQTASVLARYVEQGIQLADEEFKA